MGNCTSCESTSVATAKLILNDGRLQEFSYPIKVSYVLQKHPACFICNSDEMDFDDVVSAVDDDEELQLGQIYFELPLERLRHRLDAEEMAALAVKASSALARCGCRGFDVLSSGNSRTVERRSGGSANRSGRRRKVSAKLSAIPE